jgi:tetratricopeptide (TPR) repeat protein
MRREKPIRPTAAILSAWTLAAVLAFAPADGAAQSDPDRWQAAMDPADHAHMLGNTAEAEDHYLEALKLAERFDRTGGYLERSMSGLGGLYASEERFAEAAALYRQALTIAEALYDQGEARYGVIAIYRAALAEAEAGSARQEAAKRRAQEDAAAKRDGLAARARPLAQKTDPVPHVRSAADAPPPVAASVPARGVAPARLAGVPVSDLSPPPPAPSAPVLSHYRLSGAVVPPPPPAEILAPAPSASAPAALRLPPAVEATEAAVPEAAMTTAPAPPDIPLPPASAAPAPAAGRLSTQAALPPAVDAVEVATGDAAIVVSPRDAAAMPAVAEGLPLRGTPPPIARPRAVVPDDVATVAQAPAAGAEAAPVVAETPPADARSWESRPIEIAGRPVDAAALRALAADPAAPPEIGVRAVAEETPSQIAQRKALEARHPVLGVRLGAAKRNMGPIYPDTPRLADTEQAYFAELEALERSLGPKHPEVAAMFYKLARLYQRQSRYEPAGKMYERCLALREKILPEGHPDIIETLVNYARLLRASGFSDLAAEMRARAKAQKASAN